MYKLLASAALLLAFSLPVAAEAPPKPDDAKLAEQLFGCGSYFKFLPAVSGDQASAEQLALIKQMEDFSYIAAMALVGREQAKQASVEAHRGFSDGLGEADKKGEDALVAYMSDWQNRCTALLEQNADTIRPRIDAFMASLEAEAKAAQKAAPPTP